MSRSHLREKLPPPVETVNTTPGVRRDSVLPQLNRGLRGHAVAPDRSEKNGAGDDFEENMISEETRRELEQVRRRKFRKVLGKVLQLTTVIGCLYLVFLIYGALNTEYTYNSRGEIVPVVLSVDEIRELEEFRSMNSQYIQARTLYEQTLLLDYRLGMGAEDPLLIAPEYEKLLESVSALSVQIGAITVPARYVQPMNMLLSWVQNDIALYCQFISRAISQNSVTDMNQAIHYRETMYENFRQITQVTATLASRIPGIDASDLMSWSPEGWLEKYTGGTP